jgi:hypothetical protein
VFQESSIGRISLARIRKQDGSKAPESRRADSKLKPDPTSSSRSNGIDKNAWEREELSEDQAKAKGDNGGGGDFG